MAASGCIFHSNWINSDLSWCPFSPSNWDQLRPICPFWGICLVLDFGGDCDQPDILSIVLIIQRPQTSGPYSGDYLVDDLRRIKNNNFSSRRCKWGWGGLSSPGFDHTLIISDFCMFQLWMGSRSSFAFDHSVTSDHIWSDIWSLWCMFQLWMRSRGPSPWPLSDS